VAGAPTLEGGITPVYVRQGRTSGSPVRRTATSRSDNASGVILGQRIRRVRLQAGLGLRELAREIGISPSSLSDLENNRGGISLNRLQTVAQYFGLHITDFLADVNGRDEHADAIEIIRQCATTVPGVQRGRGVLYQLPGRGYGHAIQPALLSFEPGASYEDDMISHPGEEFVYVLLGEVELLFGSEVHRLSQGDMARYRSETPHAIRNASPVGIAHVIGAATPPW
jgi:transcriptional regulator with XRE-family HTH domain